MNGELAPFDGLLPALVNEARRRRLALGWLFATIALAALSAGLLWPKKYRSFHQHPGAGEQHHHATDGGRRLSHREQEPRKHRA